MSKVTYTFDCGCALLEDGSRAWCPTCAEGGSKSDSVDRERRHRKWALLVGRLHLLRGRLQVSSERERADRAEARLKDIESALEIITEDFRELCVTAENRQARIEALEDCVRGAWEELRWYGHTIAGGGPMVGYTKVAREAEHRWYNKTIHMVYDKGIERTLDALLPPAPDPRSGPDGPAPTPTDLIRRLRDNLCDDHESFEATNGGHKSRRDWCPTCILLADADAYLEDGEMPK